MRIVPPFSRSLAWSRAGKLWVLEVEPSQVQKAPPAAGPFIWPVGEEEFKELAAGKAAVAALASSQRAFVQKLRDTKEDEPWLHPCFWAVYTAAGDDRTRFEK